MSVLFLHVAKMYPEVIKISNSVEIAEGMSTVTDTSNGLRTAKAKELYKTWMESLPLPDEKAFNEFCAMLKDNEDVLNAMVILILYLFIISKI